jgi:hypothetical protein
MRLEVAFAQQHIGGACHNLTGVFGDKLGARKQANVVLDLLRFPEKILREGLWKTQTLERGNAICIAPFGLTNRDGHYSVSMVSTGRIFSGDSFVAIL